MSWSSRKQTSVALSTTEAEYVALATSSQEGIWLRQLLSELTKTSHEMISINEDNQSTICLPQHHGRSRHVSVKYHFVEVKYCRTEEMIATKGIGGGRFVKLWRMANNQESPK